MNHRIDLSKIPIFLTVANCLSFTEASFQLYSTQSSVSKAIASFESSLGYPLFARKGKKITLTKAGEFLYSAFKEELSRIDNIISEADRIYDGEKGKLSIGFSGYLPQNPLFETISSSFFCKYPQYELNLKLMEYQTLKRELAKQEIDAILFNNLDFEQSESYHTLTLMQNDTILLYNPLVSGWNDPETLTIEDFKNADFICVDPDLVPRFETSLLCCCKANGFVPRISKYANNVIEMIQYIGNSRYVTILSKGIYPVQSPNVNTIIIPYKPGMPVLESILAWKEDNDNPVLHLFIDIAKKYLI